MKTASPQDTFDHTMGAGAFSYSWWGHISDWDGADPGKEYTVQVENPEAGGWIKFKVSHELIMAAAKEIVSVWLIEGEQKTRSLFLADRTVYECANLIFNLDATDFDADTADQLLQFMAFHKVVFG